MISAPGTHCSNHDNANSVLPAVLIRLVWAKTLGYPNVFGLGSHQASMLAAYTAHWLDPGAVRFVRARFRNAYWPGEHLFYRAEVTAKYVDKESGHRLLELTLKCTRNHSDPVVDAWMTPDFGK